MENSVPDSLHTALDAAAASALHPDEPPPSSPSAADSPSIDRSTQASDEQTQEPDEKTQEPNRQEYSKPVDSSEDIESTEEEPCKISAAFSQPRELDLTRPSIDQSTPTQAPDEQTQEPDRQEYSEPVDSSVDIEPTEEEPRKISAACSRLRELDLNHLTPGSDYEINRGGAIKVENSVPDSLHTALDAAAASALHSNEPPPFSPTAADSPSIDRSTPIQAPDEQTQEPDRQEYSKPVDSSVDVEPTEEELREISAACSRLWELDLNRLTPGRDYEINCGGAIKVEDWRDMAEEPLFSKMNEEALRRPTYERFYALLDNYFADQSLAEEVTEVEKEEENAFVNEISRSAPIIYLRKYLAAKSIAAAGSQEEFNKQLQSLWFDLYDGGAGDDTSSAFERVFVGEIKENKRGRRRKEVLGFHNWIKFYAEEAAGRLDYRGYVLPKARNQSKPDAHSQCLTVQFKWNGVLKPKASMFVGVSPEFELALYTLCFYGGREDYEVKLGPYNVHIKCHRLHNDKLGSCSLELDKE